MGGIFAPPDVNPYGEYVYLSDEDYEAYKDAPSSENRYPPRDFYAMAIEEIRQKENQEKIGEKIIEKLMSYVTI